MHVAICGPISLRLLENDVSHVGQLPAGYQYPFAAYLVKEYIRLGHFVSVVTNTVDVDKNTRWSGKQCAIVAIPRRQKARALIRNFYRDEVREMSEALKQIAPDIIHAQWTYEFADAALVSGLPTLVTARDSPFRIARILRHPYRWLRAIYSRAYVLPRIMHLTAISDYLACELQWLHGYPRKIDVIPNGIATGRVCNNPRFGYKHHDVVNIYCVSEWGVRKNIKMLLMAFAHVREKNPNVRLILIGRGLGENDEGCAWAIKKELHVAVSFRGYQDQKSIMHGLRDEADLFVNPTLEESFGMIFIEAMSQGVACVGGKASGAVPWILNNGCAGILANVKNPIQLAEAISSILHDPIRLAVLAEEGYRRSKEIFALETIAQNYILKYQHILNQEEG
jgi:Glycosyltransferase